MKKKTLPINCEHCHGVKEVRVADIKRGWGRFCSKSCAAFAKTVLWVPYKKRSDQKYIQHVQRKHEAKYGSATRTS